jgi:hypothetical protein
VRHQPAFGVGTLGDDPGRVDLVVRAVVVALDLVEVHGLAEAGGLEQVTGVGPERRHLGEFRAVALEVPVVRGVEAHQGGEEADIRLGELVTDEIALVREPGLEPVETVEEPVVRRLVRVLAGREAALVHAVVDVVEDEVGDLVDLVAQVQRIEVGSVLCMQGRPLRGQVQRDLRVVVGDHAPARGVDDRRHGDPACVRGVGLPVGVGEEPDAEHRVDVALVQREPPTALVADRVDRAERDRALETEEPADDHRPVRPGTGSAPDQAVPAGLDRPAPALVGAVAGCGRGVRGDPVGEPVALAHELAPGPGLAGELRGHRSSVSRSPAGSTAASRRRSSVAMRSSSERARVRSPSRK